MKLFYVQIQYFITFPLHEFVRIAMCHKHIRIIINISHKMTSSGWFAEAVHSAVDQLVVQLSVNLRIGGSVPISSCPCTLKHCSVIICVQLPNNIFPTGIN